MVGGGKIAGVAAIAFLVAASAGNGAPIRGQAKKHAPKFDRRTLLVKTGGHADYAALGVRLVREIPHTDWALVAVHENAGRALGRLKHDKRVEAVEPNYIATAFETPNDPLLTKLKQPYLARLHLPTAWDRAHGDPNLRIAIVDTGVDADTPDFAGRVAQGTDIVNGDADPADDDGHGTMVAGIAAAQAGNGIGIAGAAWSATIVPVKVLDETGTGTFADVATGITWAADNGARIINLSLGGSGDDDVVRQAIAYAQSRDVLVVAAAGNDGTHEPVYPGAYPGVVAVTATNWEGDVASFSNWGPWVDLAAPGIDITSTSPAPGAHVNYATGSGTSFSAPFVTGVAALLRSANPGWSADDTANRLRSTARDAGPRGVDDAYGFGFLDADAALGGPAQPATAQPGGDDQYEPNDAPSRATPLGGNTTINAQVAFEGDVDWYAVSMSGAGVLNAYATGPDYSVAGEYAFLMDPVVDIFDSQLRPLSRFDSVLSETYNPIVRVPAAGTYYVRVANSGPSRTTSPYTLTTMSSTGTDAPRFVGQKYLLPDSPEGAAVGDVTGDGRADVLVTTSVYDGYEPFKLVLYRQLADGWLADPVFLPTDGTGGEMSVATGDVNGDGKTDAVVAASAGVDVYLQGSNGLGAPTLVDAPGAQQVVPADVNGDGRLDMLVGAGGNGVYLLLGGPSGWTRSTVTTAEQTQVVVGDVTGDGRPDVVGFTWTTLHVYPQTGTGTFGAPVDVAGSQTDLPGAGIAVADLNGDGRKDVAMSAGGNGISARVDLFLQTPAGTLAAPTVLPSYEIPESVAAGDLNGDGRADLVVDHHAWGKAGVYLQQADGTLAPEERYDVAGGTDVTPQAIGIGDVNGDGAADIAIADFGAGLTLLRQRTPSWPAPAVVAQTTSPADLATNVATSAAPTVQLARAFDPPATTVSLVDGVTGTAVAGSPAYSGATMTFQPASALAAGRPYTLRLGTPGDDPEIVVHFTTAGAAADTTPPDTYIEYGPPSSTSSQASRFAFTASEPGVVYECAEDGSSWYPCRSPKIAYDTWVGAHTFTVRAIDAAGNADPTPATRSYTITATPPTPPNDYVWDAQVISGNYGSVTGTNLGASEQDEPPVEGNEGGRSVWYSWTAGASGQTTFDTRGSSFDTLLAVYILPGGTVDEQGSNDDVSLTDRTSSVTFNAVAGTTYYIVVDGFDDGFDAAMGSVQLNWRGPGAPNDVLPPTVRITSPANGARVPGLVQIAADASDDTSVARVEFRADGTLIATDTSAPYQATWDASALAQGSTHQLEARAVDVTGKTAVDTHSVVVDPTPPETAITGGPSGTVTSSSANFSFSANESASFFCRLESDYGYGTYEPCTSPKTYNGLAGGHYWFNVYAVDTVGNADQTPARQAWTLFNDYFAAATDLGNDGRLASGSNVGATKEAGEPNHAGNRGGRSIWYVWHAPSTPVTVTIDTQGSTFDTLLGVYTGNSVSALSTVASNDNYGGSSWSRVSFTASPGTTYRIAVDGRSGRAGNVTLAVGIAGASDTTPPETTITSGPSGTVTATSATFAFSSSESGSSFQCHLDGAAFSACSSPVSYSGLASGTHTFYVRATDAAGNTDPTPASQSWTVSAPADTTPPETTITSGPSGTVTSTSATFAFSSSESGSSFECHLDGAAFAACSSPVSYSGLATGSHTFYVRATDAAGNSDPTPASQSWTVSAPADTTPPETTITSGPSGTVTATSATFAFSSSESGSSFECHLDGAVFSACGSPVSYSGLADGTHTFYVRAADASGNTDPTPASQTWTIASSSGGPANDNFGSAQAVSGTAGSTTGSNVGASKESGEPNHAGNPGGKSIWYAWTPSQSGTATVDTIGSAFDTVLGVYTGTTVSALTYVASDDDSGGNLNSRATFAVVAGSTYRIAVDGYNAASGSVKLDWSIATASGAPANDNFESAQAITGSSGSVTSSNSGATKEPGEPNHAGNAGGHSIWYAWTAPTSGTVTIDTIGSGFDTIMGVYTGGSVSALTAVASDDDSGGNLNSKVTFAATAGVTYRVAVDGYAGAVGSVKLNWSQGGGVGAASAGGGGKEPSKYREP